MSEILSYFLSDLEPSVLFSFVRTLPKLLSSSYLPFWFFLFIPFLRFMVPTLIAWGAAFFRPQLYRPVVPRKLTVANPMVTVLMAGLNEADNIAGSLNSLLRCGYGNLEIIFVDDGSSDATLAIARKVAASIGGGVGGRNDKLRVFSSPRRNGKASALNIGLSMARGEFIIVMDADNEIQFGAIPHWLAAFTDAGVGAATANLRVGNAHCNLLTKLQDVEFSVNVLLWRLLAAKMGILAIVSGGGGMFRASVLRAAGGFDSGLGEDTDMTIRLIKMGWRAEFAVDALVWANVPTTWKGLIKQRIRWARNMVKIRLSKHRDTLSPLQRYGWRMGFIASHTLVVRAILIWSPMIAILYMLATNPTQRPLFLSGAYAVVVLWGVVKLLIIRDLTGMPSYRRLMIVPLMPFYYTLLRFISLYGLFVELTRLRARHAYIPSHIWEQTPHW
jgi:cellulose synthase/poly-beta-1,6-N-acetylglucosamine synthase-like glycosyltransferase